MAHEIAHLCSERHYVGSSSSGRFATNRNARPAYDCIPGAYAFARSGATKTAWYARYLREQGAIGWVLDHADATSFLERGQQALDSLTKRRDAASDTESHDAAQKSIDLLEARMAEATAVRKEASRQLRLLGVSPKEQAQILAETRRRTVR